MAIHLTEESRKKRQRTTEPPMIVSTVRLADAMRVPDFADIIPEISDLAKVVVYHVHISASVNLVGFFRLSPTTLAFFLGSSRAKIVAALTELSAFSEIMIYDPETDMILLKNHLRRYRPKTVDHIAAVLREIDEVPTRVPLYSQFRDELLRVAPEMPPSLAEGITSRLHTPGE